MKRAQKIGMGILAAVSLAFAASAGAAPGEGGRMGHGARGEAHAQGEQHDAMQCMPGKGMQRMPAMQGMQARMRQRMAQHQGGHGAGARGCPMEQASAAQGEHRH